MLVKHINNLFHCILQGNAKFDFLIDAITECCRNVMARSLNFGDLNADSNKLSIQLFV